MTFLREASVGIVRWVGAQPLGMGECQQREEGVQWRPKNQRKTGPPKHSWRGCSAVRILGRRLVGLLHQEASGNAVNFHHLGHFTITLPGLYPWPTKEGSILLHGVRVRSRESSKQGGDLAT